MYTKKCDFTDYQLNDQTRALYEFNERRQRLYYCPDLQKGLRRIDDDTHEIRKSEKELFVQGTIYDKNIAEMWFQIMRCDDNSYTKDKTDPKCAPKEEIDQFIR